MIRRTFLKACGAGWVPISIWSMVERFIRSLSGPAGADRFIDDTLKQVWIATKDPFEGHIGMFHPEGDLDWGLKFVDVDDPRVLSNKGKGLRYWLSGG